MERLLGRGAMGEVYLARDPQIDRPLAVKTLRLAGVDEEELSGRRQRLLREARTAGRLIHPHIVTLFDAGEQDGLLFLAFEYVPGSDLAQRLKAGPLPVGEALRIVRETCEGLGHAHRHGVIHRDVKPANLLLDADGRVKISDFGIAKISNDTSGLTVTGTVMGSPHYMSPEQVRGEELDGRSDLFSLGVVLYETISGRRPFAGDTLTTLVYQILSGEPPELPPLAAGLDPRLPTLLDRLLAKERDDRLPDAASAAAEVAALEAELPPPVLAAPALEDTGPTDVTRPMPQSGSQQQTHGAAPPPPPPPPAAPVAPDRAAAPVPPPPPPQPPAAPVTAGEGSYAVPSMGGRRRTAVLAALVLGLLLAVGVLAVVLLRGGDREEEKAAGAATAPVEQVAQTPVPQEPPPQPPAGGAQAAEPAPAEAPPPPAASGSAQPSPAGTPAAAADRPPPSAPSEPTEPESREPASPEPASREVEPMRQESAADVSAEPTADAVPQPAAAAPSPDEPAPGPTPEAAPSGPPVRAELNTSLRVHFDVLPPDAFVLVDGTVIGRAAEFSSRSGRSHTLPGPGAHHVTLRRDGMEDVHLALDADPARPGVTPVRARMNRLAAAETPLHELETYRVREGVALRVQPPSTRVLVDGELKGPASRYSGGGGPFRRGRILELPLGVHRVTLMAPGRRRVDFAVDVTAGASRDHQRVELTLPPLPAGAGG